MATRCAGAADDDAGDRISEQSGAERSRPRHSRLPTTEKLPWLRRSAARPRHWRRRRQQQLFRPCSLSAATRSRLDWLLASTDRAATSRVRASTLQRWGPNDWTWLVSWFPMGA